ncbi:SGNH/GDSL hydrolase family protein [Granulicella cerasi]|uniref:SGNH/GDSL hydrolase family protein n=1 Tax=Granulicella cerasi TaxID=741063 RepID=A0ABW1ZBD9_9BACT|nr:SGNH/GDSL hydrolase family protein [Granulicella cerasi]
MRALLLPFALALFAAPLLSQTAPTAQPAADPEKELATLKSRYEDFGCLKCYGAEDAMLAPQAGRVVFFGDSITAVWGREVGTFFPGKPYVNRGISGQTTSQMLLRFQQDVVRLHPELVVILAGTNDVAANTGPMTPEMTEDNLTSMVELAAANHIRVVMASVTPALDFPWRRGLNPAPKIRTLNAWIRSYAASHGLVYLDYYRALADADGGMKPGMSKEGVHPSEAGYAVMGPLAEKAVAEAMSRPKP